MHEIRSTAASPDRARCHFLLGCLLVVVLVRIATLGSPALLDTTEGRYGAMALHMLDSGDWVTPQIPLEHGFEPYLGKPPLHFWLAAASLAVFGTNEWAVRLPSLLMALLMLAGTMSYARSRFGAVTACTAGAVLMTTGLFYFAAGSVNVDITVAAMASLAVLAFCRVGDEATRNRRWWGYLFFFTLACGFLTKGPVVLAYTGLVGIMHLLVFRDWRIVTRLPWPGGAVVFLAIVVPWFWIAAARHPDFLHYFFVSENLERFATSHYGDRYGSARTHFLGATLVFLLPCTLPWVLVPIVRLCQRGGWAQAKGALRSENTFLLLWAVAPALLFSLSPQFTVGYLMPGFGAMAILVARLLENVTGSAIVPLSRLLRGIRLLCPLLALFVVVAAWIFVGTSLPRGLLALAVAGLLACWQRRRQLRPDDLPAAAAAGAVALATTYLVLLLVGTPYVSGTRSVAPILQCFLANAPAGSHTVGLCFGHHYSGYFYASAWAGDRVQLRYVGSESIAKTQLHDLFLKSVDVATLPACAQQRYVVAGDAGAWSWLTQR